MLPHHIETAVKKIIEVAKKRGFVTIDELNNAFPDRELSSDQVEDIFAMLNDLGINIVETNDGRQ